jgi:hypothetical protein
LFLLTFCPTGARIGIKPTKTPEEEHVNRMINVNRTRSAPEEHYKRD